MSYEWSESQQAFVLREPAVPVSALRALLERDVSDDTVVEAYQRLVNDIAALCNSEVPK